MLQVELPISVVILTFYIIDVTSSTGTVNGNFGDKFRDTYEPSSYYYGSSSSTETKIQDFIDESMAKCFTREKAHDVAEFLESFSERLSKATIDKLDRIDDKLANFESAEKNNTSSQVKGLKEKVTEEASKAHCPAPDDPSLMGEFDCIIELVYEMCYANLIDKVDKMRFDLIERVEVLIDDIITSIESLEAGTYDPTRTCRDMFKRSKDVLQSVEQMMDNEYKSELQSVYTTCFNIAYGHAVNFMPSVIQRATSCRMQNWNTMNPLDVQ